MSLHYLICGHLIVEGGQVCCSYGYWFFIFDKFHVSSTGHHVAAKNGQMAELFLEDQFEHLAVGNGALPGGHLLPRGLGPVELVLLILGEDGQVLAELNPVGAPKSEGVFQLQAS